MKHGHRIALLTALSCILSAGDTVVAGADTVAAAGPGQPAVAAGRIAPRREAPDRGMARAAGHASSGAAQYAATRAQAVAERPARPRPASTIAWLALSLLGLGVLYSRLRRTSGKGGSSPASVGVYAQVVRAVHR